MFDKILLPIDLNHPASWEKALPIALKVAAATGEIHVLGIVHDLGAAIVQAYLPQDFEKHAIEQMKTDLDAFVADKMPAGVKASVHVGHGHVPETILKTATAIGADLIVMASHAPNDFRTLLIGSYADKVVHYADVPVLVAR